MALKLFTLPAKDIPTTSEAVAVHDVAIPVTTVIFYADDNNSGVVYIGDENVSSTRYAVALDAEESFTISADTFTDYGDEFILSDFYAATDNAGDDVRVSYVKRR